MHIGKLPHRTQDEVEIFPIANMSERKHHARIEWQTKLRAHGFTRFSRLGKCVNPVRNHSRAQAWHWARGVEFNRFVDECVAQKRIAARDRPAMPPFRSEHEIAHWIMHDCTERNAILRE